MKKCLILAGLAAAVLVHQPSPLFAKDDPFTKFGRGMANITLSIGEFYTQPILLTERHDVPTACFGGLLKGAAMFVSREVVGLYEVVTFLVPIPKGYRPIIEPATTFTDWDTRNPLA